MSRLKIEGMVLLVGLACRAYRTWRRIHSMGLASELVRLSRCLQASGISGKSVDTVWMAACRRDTAFNRQERDGSEIAIRRQRFGLLAMSFESRNQTICSAVYFDFHVVSDDGER